MKPSLAFVDRTASGTRGVGNISLLETTSKPLSQVLLKHLLLMMMTLGIPPHHHTCMMIPLSNCRLGPSHNQPVVLSQSSSSSAVVVRNVVNSQHW